MQTAIHGHGCDRRDVGVGHAVDHDRDIEAVVDQRVECELGGIDAERFTELGQGPTGPVRMTRRERDA